MIHFLIDANFMMLFSHRNSAAITMLLLSKPLVSVSVMPLTPNIILLEKFPFPIKTYTASLGYPLLKPFTIRWYQVQKSYLVIQ